MRSPVTIMRSVSSSSIIFFYLPLIIYIVFIFIQLYIYALGNNEFRIIISYCIVCISEIKTNKWKNWNKLRKKNCYPFYGKCHILHIQYLHFLSSFFEYLFRPIKVTLKASIFCMMSSDWYANLHIMAYIINISDIKSKSSNHFFYLYTN